MGRHGTRGAEIDRMLRAGLFVDLHAIVKGSVRASVERYSIKDLEPLYGFQRSVALEDARTALRVVERGLELGGFDHLATRDVRAAVEGYNLDDCLSASALRDWLEQVRAGVEAEGVIVPRPAPKSDEPTEAVSQRAARVATLMKALTFDVPADPAQRSEEQRARWLLAQLLDWHGRENKVSWWDYFRLSEACNEELLDEKAALAGLTFVERIPPTGRGLPVDRYAFPEQEADLHVGDELHAAQGIAFGTVHAFDVAARTVDIKKKAGLLDDHPPAVFAHSHVDTNVLADALLRLGEDVARHGMGGLGQLRAARELLLARAPRLRRGSLEAAPRESALDVALRVVSELDHSIVAIQGPPGAGKTFTGARLIVELVRQGKRVGVTANSHAVIDKLLVDVSEAAVAASHPVECLHKVSKKRDPIAGIQDSTDNARVLARIVAEANFVAAGTPWLWAREDARDVLDVLFVDEAGQMSLANVLACSQAAKSVVLLGDPQQLEQPQQGSHPDGAERSALEHLLDGSKTMPLGKGLFLSETWRLAPSLCGFTSEVFYEGRLRPRPELAQQTIVGTGALDGSGLWVLPVEHDGNQSASPEEVEAIARLVDRLLVPTAAWIDAHGAVRPLHSGDVLVVAPYNAQVAALSARLASRGIRVGTVDKFQGQEAPIVIYSMATSSPEDAPRGMEFLYSLNRLNVATSRARCASFLVASPRIFTPECKTPRQMQLANALCRYLELAHVVA